jgi:hypothetical protein
MLTIPILVKNRNVNTRIKSSLAHPSDFLTKFGVPDVWLEEVAPGDTQN